MLWLEAFLPDGLDTFAEIIEDTFIKSCSSVTLLTKAPLELVGHATEKPDGTYRDLYLYCAQHTLGSHVGIYNYTNFGNEGYAKQTTIDFGGDDKRGTTHDDEYFTDICKWLMWLLGDIGLPVLTRAEAHINIAQISHFKFL